MKIIKLGEELVFPPVEQANDEGIVAYGGDLSTGRLVLAYSQGIFPWYEEGYPILWWSPDPRFVLFPDELIISKSMSRVMKSGVFRITCDTSFREVIKSCSSPRRNSSGTWITNDMIEAYCRLHDQGIAHSIEVWKNGTLAGGLYGVALGKIFFGESMFSLESNSSKAALIYLTGKLKEKGFLLIDSQVWTKHLESLGARLIPRNEYLEILKRAIAE